MNVIDRVASAKHTLTGSGLGKAVSKATSHEIIGPKKKHVDYIQNALETDNVSIPDTADMLFERCTNSSWVVVFKALVTFHNLMSNANERFMQYVASRSTTWMLQTFLDKGGVQGYDMSHAIRRYSAYLSEKAFAYRSMGYDFCRVARGKNDGVLRNMDAPKLLKALPALQTQLDALIATEIGSNDLTNGVITSAFMTLFKDLIRLFACYNDGIINLLEKYFEMKKTDCKAALEIYKRFLARMERVSEFLKVAEDAGINKGDIPDLTKAPHSLLDALDEHYQSLEKGRSVSPPTKPITLPAFTVDQSLSAFTINQTTTQNGFNSTPDTQDDYLQEQQKMLALFETKKKDEEAKKLQQQKQQQFVPNPLAPPQHQQHHNHHQQQLSFSSEPVYAQPQKTTKPSEDLFSLSTSSNIPNNNALSSNQFGAGMSLGGTTMSNDAFGYNTQSMSNQIDFNHAFNQSNRPNQSSSTPNLMDDLLIPERQGSSNTTTPDATDSGRLTGDLNRGIERIALSLDGLNVNPGTLKVNTQKGHQWTPQQPAVKTGGANFQMSNVARSTFPQQPGFGGPSPMGMASPRYQQPMQPMMQPNMQQYGMQQGATYGYPMMQPQSRMYQPQMGYNQQQMNPLMMNNDPFK